MKLKKSISLLLVLLLTPLVLVSVVQSIGPPTITINLSSVGITVYGYNWTPYNDVTIYYDVEDDSHMVAVVEANYGGMFQALIPTKYVAAVGPHTVIAVQGADKATAVYDVKATAPPDDRLLNPILNINNFLQNDIKADLQSIKNTLSQPLEVTNPAGESLNVNVTNTLDVSGWLHTVKNGSFKNPMSLPPSCGTYVEINTEGYRLITLSFVTTTSAPTWKIEFQIEHWLYCGPPCRNVLSTVSLNSPDYCVKPITFEITMNKVVVYMLNFSPTETIDVGEIKVYYFMTT